MIIHTDILSFPDTEHLTELYMKIPKIIKLFDDVRFTLFTFENNIYRPIVYGRVDFWMLLSDGKSDDTFKIYLGTQNTVTDFKVEFYLE